MDFPADVAVAEEPQGEDGDEVFLVSDVVHFEAELIHEVHERVVADLRAWLVSGRPASNEGFAAYSG